MQQKTGDTEFIINIATIPKSICIYWFYQKDSHRIIGVLGKSRFSVTFISNQNLTYIVQENFLQFNLQLNLTVIVKFCLKTSLMISSLSILMSIFSFQPQTSCSGFILGAWKAFLLRFGSILFWFDDKCYYCQEDYTKL